MCLPRRSGNILATVDGPAGGFLVRLTKLLIAAAAAASCVLAGGGHAATLIHAYDFDGSGVTDSVGGANGALNGGASVSGGALHLDGSDDFVAFSSYLIPAGPTGYSVYLNVQGAPGAHHTEIISQGSSGGGFYIGTDPAGNFRLTDTFLSTGIAYPTGSSFHDLLLTVSSAGTNFYIDGTNVFTSAAPAAAGLVGDFTQLGRQFGGNGEYFAGQINTLKIFDGVATQADLADSPGGSAAPEPAAWAMMILGLGGAGAMLRRRRVAAA